MKIIHTADWHLGQTFYEYDRHAEHLHFLDWLCQEIKERNADVLLVSGDIFDGPNPSAEAQRLYFSFLHKVTVMNPALQIIVIAGNHDSAARLESPNPLLESMHITVRGGVNRINGEIDYNRLIVPIYSSHAILNSNDFTEDDIIAYCLAVPYLRQGDYPQTESYGQGVQLLYRNLYDIVKDKCKPVIAMGHLQATGSEISENDRSERTIIGGVEGVSPDSFDKDIIYTALGHLHRSQRVSKRENVRYSGTPIPMSFAERNNTNSVVLIDYSDGNTVIEKIEIPVLTTLLSIPPKSSEIDVVLDCINKLEDGPITEQSPYLEIKLSITGPDTSYKFKIEQALEGKSVKLARIASTLPKAAKSTMKISNYEELQKIEPFDVALDYYKKKYGEVEMPDKMKDYLKEVIEEAQL